MKIKGKKTKEDLFYFPKDSLLFPFYRLKRNWILITAKDGGYYVGKLISLDKNFNLYLKYADFFLKTKKGFFRILKNFQKLILNGNKISIITPIVLKK